jgi:hypothetical protein
VAAGHDPVAEQAIRLRISGAGIGCIVVPVVPAIATVVVTVIGASTITAVADPATPGPEGGAGEHESRDAAGE